MGMMGSIHVFKKILKCLYILYCRCPLIYVLYALHLQYTVITLYKNKSLFGCIMDLFIMHLINEDHFTCLSIISANFFNGGHFP